MLLAKGANPNLRAEGGLTVFHEVAATGQIDVAEMLLKRGGDINATDSSGKTPLAHASAARKMPWRMVAGARREVTEITEATD